LIGCASKSGGNNDGAFFNSIGSPVLFRACKRCAMFLFPWKLELCTLIG
jgi:hypothetical protein